MQNISHLELRHLEEAMIGQFVWKRPKQRENETEADFEDRLRDTHRLMCDKDYECLSTMALIVFVGIAYKYGFSESSVIRYLEIDKRLYDACFGLFNKYSAIAKEKAGKRTLDFTTPAGRLYLKTSLIGNYLRHNRIAA